MRLIDADALAIYLADRFSPNGEYPIIDMLSGLMHAIYKSPTIEAEPVRHGRWGGQEIIGYDGLHAIYAQPCNECGYKCQLYMAHYCPNCGAKMDAKEEPHEDPGP